MKISLVVTVLNEEKTIEPFLNSVEKQTLKPDEVIIVDGGSVDWTLEILAERKEKIRVLIMKGANRSLGRNRGVEEATGDIIAFTDAGCVLDKNWLLELTKPFSDEKVEVVAGYYNAITKSAFEKCVAPYALVMPDRVNPKNFLPASRSMAIRKETFNKAGGFPLNYSDNEDYVFANQLKKMGTKMILTKDAIVSWMPRTTLRSFWKMIYRFARGDAKAGLRTLKVLSVFARYGLLLLLLFLSKYFNNFLLYFSSIFFLYLLWSVVKNYKYVKDLRAFYILPLLQLTSDFAVISGTIVGLLSREI
jgi:glycosyltransferase involved in cell wall biosynthesis